MTQNAARNQSGGAGSSGNFAFEGLKIRVSSTDAQDLAWLKEFLGPQFGGFRSGSPDCAVHLTYDAKTHASLLSAGPHPSRVKLNCYNLDRKTIRLPVWRARCPGRVIFDREFNVFYSLARGGRDISITAAAANLWSGRISLMRVIRELGMNQAAGRRAMILHGAAFLLNGKGVLVPGPKGAGKTSLLTYFLQKGRALYVSNDRVLVDLSRRRPRMRGIPTIVTLRQTMLEMFPAVARRLEASNFNPCLRLQEARRAPLGPAAVDAEGRFHVSPGQLCELTGSGAAAGGPVSLLLFPRIVPADAGVSLVRMSPDSAVVKIRAALLHSGNSGETTVFNARARRNRAIRKPGADLARQTASRISCFECRLGGDAIAGDALLHHLLTQLGEKNCD